MTFPCRTSMKLFMASMRSSASTKSRIAPEETPFASGVPRGKEQGFCAAAWAVERVARTAKPRASLVKDVIVDAPLLPEKQSPVTLRFILWSHVHKDFK